MKSHAAPRKMKRNSVRFKPDEGTYALIDTDADTKEFDPNLPVLVFSEAHKGVGIIALTTPKLQVGDPLKIQVGNLPVLKAEVRWREQVDPQVIKVGIMFLE